jgi:hypothetical protein
MKSTPKTSGSRSARTRAHPSNQKEMPRLVVNALNAAQPANSDVGDLFTGCDGIKGDYLCGGAGSGADTYHFSGQFGKDRVVDADGAGVIEINGQTLGIAKAAGQANTWVARLGATQVELRVYDDSSSATGKRLVIAAEGDSAKAFTLHLSVPAAAAKNHSKTIAVNPRNKSCEIVFCFKNEAANDGWMRRAA